MTTTLIFGLWAVFLVLAVGSRFGQRHDGLTPVQRWVTAHRLGYSIMIGAAAGAAVALTSANPWLGLVGAGVAAVSWTAMPRAEARLRRRYA